MAIAELSFPGAARECRAGDHAHRRRPGRGAAGTGQTRSGVKGAEFPLRSMMLRVPKTCAAWAKALQSAAGRSVCAGPVSARPEVG